MEPQPITIAIADDHPPMLALLAGMVTGFGYQLAIAAPGAEALLAWLETAPQPPRVLLADIRMPGMDGYALTQAIKERWPAIRIMACSMQRDAESLLLMLQHGATGYWSKDRDPQELHHAIHAMATEGSYIDEWALQTILTYLKEP